MSVIGKSLREKINILAHYPQTGLSLKQLVYFGKNPTAGKVYRAGLFLRDELPIRFAHRIKELEDLPPPLHDMKRIQGIQQAYAKSMEEIIELQNIPLPEPPSSFGIPDSKAPRLSSNVEDTDIHNPSLLDTHLDSSKGRYFFTDFSYECNSEICVDKDCPKSVHLFNHKFAKLLDIIQQRHNRVAIEIALDVLEYHSRVKRIDPGIQKFLDRFYMSRIGIRFLLSQQITLATEPLRPGYVGVINTHARIRELIEVAVENARYICQQAYGLFEAPEVQIVCNPNITMMYVESHLQHALFEILKNSLRAVVEHHGVDSDTFPPIKVIVAEGAEDITIKVSDEGGGISRRNMPLVWSYMYTTASPQLREHVDSEAGPPLAGFGFGLPMARLYTRYFGGDLELISMDGYGTDVFVHLNKLCESAEPLQ
ncbi:pyruvate dehydrogenase kinase Pkp1 [Schizosaccharomyces japonicus yFS275]|uniref:Protein-serine/threonine kinase n=1 Tax=Schizosaccharomyces japonicus (strain yFS275 / FY16936) TaxID=402676 RepID=B6JXT8_SCHJY|nr:pyruvate dehydrogenase kinase Pkp1 [Schizosaccharomyces japonicus yFS275]EEB06356.1 pyruvate dehydrogenase kinase Pkp1 [Schizosaccharomyces japonicus yFS275]